MSTTSVSALDIPMHVTFFASAEASDKRGMTETLRSLATRAKTIDAPSKDKLMWVKLAKFGEDRTDKGSLRHNANMQEVSGVEGDYDTGEITPERAAELLTAANIAALIYTSPSHRTFDKDTAAYKGERWRVLCPLSRPHTTAERSALLARVNGALGGVLAGESFTPSQSYYIGGVGGVKPQTILVDGRPIDLAPELDATAVGKSQAAKPGAKPGGAKLTLPELPAGLEPDETALAALQAACALFDDPGEHQNHDIILAATMHVASFVKSGHLEPEMCIKEIRKALASHGSGRKENDGEVAAALTGALDKVRAYVPPSDVSERAAANLAEAQADFGAVPLPAETKPAKAKFQWLDMGDIEDMPDPTWLVEDVLPSQGVAATFGPPKEGKTFAILSVALHIAAGKPWFGHTVDQGAVYYIAGEGAGGLKLRIKAARAHYGLPRNIPFHMLSRAAKFTDPGEIGELIGSIHDKHIASGVPVRMVVVDTLARAMPGSDENGAKDMGSVIEQCDRLRDAFQCVTMLVHHTGKDLTRGMRGSNSLDGAVDCAIKVTLEKTATSSVVTVENKYQKEGETFPTMFFDLVKVADPDGGRGSLALTVRHDAPVKAKVASPKHDAALRIVREMAAELQDGAKLDKQAVIERCAADPFVTEAKRPNDRRRIVGGYLNALVSEGRLAASGEHVWLDEPSIPLTDLLLVDEP